MAFRVDGFSICEPFKNVLENYSMRDDLAFLVERC